MTLNDFWNSPGQINIHLIVLHRVVSPEVLRKGFWVRFVSDVLLLFTKKSARGEKKSLVEKFVFHEVKKSPNLYGNILTCDLWVDSEFGQRPLPADGRHLSRTFWCVGDSGLVLLVVGAAGVVLLVALAMGRYPPDVILPTLWLVECSSMVWGDFLPLEAAGQRCVSLEVEVPAAGVLLRHLLQFLLQVSAQLLAVHRAKQTPAHRLSWPDGVHPVNGPGVRGWKAADVRLYVCLLLWSILEQQGDLKAAGRHGALFVHKERRLLIGCSCINWWMNKTGEDDFFVSWAVLGSN